MRPTSEKVEKVLHRQPDSVKSMDKMSEIMAVLNPHDFARFGLKNSGEVINFLKSDSGKQVRNSIILELEKKKFFQETIAMEQAERKQLFLSMMASVLFSRVTAAETKEERQEAEALLRLMLINEDDDYQKALQDVRNRSDAYTPDLDTMHHLYAAQINLHDLEQELALLNELTNELVKGAGFIYEELEKYVIEKEKQIENEVDKALKNLPEDVSEEDKEAERLKLFEEFTKKEFEKELEVLDKQVSQTSEAKSTEPGMGSAPKPMPTPQNEKEKQAFGKLKQAFAQHMLHRVNQVAAPGDQPRADLAAQANMNINPEQFRSNLIAHHTTIREQFNAFRTNGFSDERKILNDKITYAQTNISKDKTTLENNVKHTTEATKMKKELITQRYDQNVQKAQKPSSVTANKQPPPVAPTTPSPFNKKPTSY